MVGNNRLLNTFRFDSFIFNFNLGYYLTVDSSMGVFSTLNI